MRFICSLCYIVPTHMRSIVFSTLFAVVVLLAVGSFQPVEAHSGCCSWHGGVCGCGCCDGTALSSTCAPYYPECSSTTSTTSIQNNTPTQIATPIPTYTPVRRVTYIPRSTKTPTISPSPTVTPKPTKAPTQQPLTNAAQVSKSLLQPDSFWTRILKFFHLF